MTYKERLRSTAERMHQVAMPNSLPLSEYEQDGATVKLYTALAADAIAQEAEAWVAGRQQGYADGIREDPLNNPLLLNEAHLATNGYIETH